LGLNLDLSGQGGYARVERPGPENPGAVPVPAIPGATAHLSGLL
jgi:hypothetical protein